MVRIIVTIEEADKKWLDSYSDQNSQSTVETIRVAIKEFRKSRYQSVLIETAGLFKEMSDSVGVVRALRKEWNR